MPIVPPVHNQLSQLILLRQARGSLTEALDHLICAFDSGYIDEKKLNEFESDYSFILKLLNGYIAYLKKRKDEE